MDIKFVYILYSLLHHTGMITAYAYCFVPVVVQSIDYRITTNCNALLNKSNEKFFVFSFVFDGSTNERTDERTNERKHMTHLKTVFQYSEPSNHKWHIEKWIDFYWVKPKYISLYRGGALGLVERKTKNTKKIPFSIEVSARKCRWRKIKLKIW